MSITRPDSTRNAYSSLATGLPLLADIGKCDAITRFHREGHSEGWVESAQGVDVEFVENPRRNKTLVEDFVVDTTDVKRTHGWKPQSPDAHVCHII